MSTLQRLSLICIHTYTMVHVFSCSGLQSIARYLGKEIRFLFVCVSESWPFLASWNRAKGLVEATSFFVCLSE